MDDRAVLLFDVGIAVLPVEARPGHGDALALALHLGHGVVYELRPLSSCSEVIGNGKHLSSLLSASTALCMPLLHSMASGTGLLRPERLLALAAKGFTLGRPLNTRSRVDALVASIAALSSRGFVSAMQSSYSRTMRGSSTTK